MNESAATRKLCKALRDECGARVFSLVGGSKQTVGLPDRYVAHPTWTGWLEFKAGPNKLTRAQAEFIRWVRACNEARGLGPGAWVIRFTAGADAVTIEDHEGEEFVYMGLEHGPKALLERLKELDDVT